MERTARLNLWMLILAGAVVIQCGGHPPVQEKPTAKAPQWYLERYPFMDDWGKVFTFESEFEWPAGYYRPDSASLPPYSFWVSHFPLYHKDRSVSSFRHGKIFDAEEISRTVDLNWRTPKFRDDIIPIQMLGEYFLYAGRQEELSVLPKLGETMNYGRWLESKVAYGSRRDLKSSPSTKRPNSKKEFSRFFDLCANNTSYESLKKNCTLVEDDDVLPGDIYITSDKAGNKGQAYVVLCMLTNRHHRKIYTVGTGCNNVCDFYIPLVNENRSYPWVTVEQIRALAPDFETAGFYRFKNVSGLLENRGSGSADIR